MQIGAVYPVRFVDFFGRVGPLSTSLCASFGASGAPGSKQGVRGGEAGCREVAKAGCCVLAKAGCRDGRGRMSPQNEAGCRCTLFAHHKTACLLTLSPLACHEAACR